MSEADLAAQVIAAMRQNEGPTAALGIMLDDLGPGWAKVSLTISKVMLNGLGSAHGGVLFTLADTAFAYACNSRNMASVGNSTTMTFLTPGRLGERVSAEAREATLVGRSGIYDIRVLGDDGRVIAIFQGLSRSLGRPVIQLDTGALIDA